MSAAALAQCAPRTSAPPGRRQHSGAGAGAGAGAGRWGDVMSSTRKVGAGAGGPLRRPLAPAPVAASGGNGRASHDCNGGAGRGDTSLRQAAPPRLRVRPAPGPMHRQGIGYGHETGYGGEKMPGARRREAGDRDVRTSAWLGQGGHCELALGQRQISSSSSARLYESFHPEVYVILRYTSTLKVSHA